MAALASLRVYGTAKGKRDDLVGGGLKRSQPDCLESGEIAPFDERILGSGGFVELLTQGGSLRLQSRASLILNVLLDKVGAVTGVAAERLQCPGKERDVVRAVFCFLAVFEESTELLQQLVINRC